MPMLSCPYCQQQMASPPPKSAGQFFTCGHCRQVFQWTGISAVVAAQPAPLSVNQNVNVKPTRQGFGIGDGFKLAFGFFLFGVFLIFVPIIVLGTSCAAYQASLPH